MADDVKVYPRTIASIWGEPKKGKSHFGMTFPKPMVAVEIGETGIEDLLPKFTGVDYRPLIIPTLRPSINDHERLLADFEGIVNEVVGSKTVRTILIDSTSHLWRHIRVVMTEIAHQEAQRKKKNQADFELANDYFEQVIQNLRRNRQLNIVLIHRHREKFAQVPTESGGTALQATGEVEARDYKGIENLAQLIIRAGDGLRLNPRTKEQERHFKHTIEICRWNKALEGTQMWNMTYDSLMERIWDGNNPAA